MKFTEAELLAIQFPRSEHYGISATFSEKMDFTVRFLNFADDQIEPEVLPGPGNSTVTKTYALDYLTFPFQAFIVTLTTKP